MKAVVRDTYGSADVLELRDVGPPAPAAGEVLIRVHAAGLDRGAWHIMTGTPVLMRIAGFGLRRPKDPSLGGEVAGVVEAAGADVSAFGAGDQVFGLGQGSFAEYCTARPQNLAHKPAGLAYEQAAALCVSACTALQALRDHGKVRPGQHVLIIGASGGVGSFAVQIAKAFGAEVTGVCSTGKLERVRALGADHVIDYTAGDLSQAGVRYDLVLDIGGNRPVRVLRRLLTPTGALVFVGGEDGRGISGGLTRQLRSMLLAPFVRQRLGGLWIASQPRADLEVLAGMAVAGQIAPALDRVCALADIPCAMRDLEAGRVTGKVVAAIAG